MKLFRKPLSDEERVAQIRKCVDRFDRYGYLVSVFFLGLLLPDDNPFQCPAPVLEPETVW